MRNGLRSPSNLATASGLVASPHSTRCEPQIHKSPVRVTGESGSGGAASSQRKGPTLRHDGTGCDAGHHDCAIGTRRRNVVGCDRCVRFHPDHRPCFHAARRPSHHRRRNRRRDWAVADLLADRGLGCVKPCSAGGQHPGRALITGKRTRLRSSRRTKARSTRLLARGYF